LPVESRCRLGETPQTGSLGRTAVAGAWVWSAQHRFAIVLGALGYADYQRFLPGQASLAQLTAMVRSYVGDSLGWELRLVLTRGEVPPLRLGAQGRLGWTTWLPGGRFEYDPSDLVFEPMACSQERD
jgi:type VI secretion system protein ImpH